MILRNFTPHPVRLAGSSAPPWEPNDGLGAAMVLPSEGLARVSSSSVKRLSVRLRPEARCREEEVVDCPLVTEELGEVVGLPDSEPGVLFVVSRMVCDATRRGDVVYPTDFLRDKDGNILAARALGMPPATRSALEPVLGVRHGTGADSDEMR